MMAPRLSPAVARTDLTDRECSKIIGGLLGSLCTVADVDAVRRAVQWWAETPEAWAAITQGIAMGKSLSGGRNPL